MRAEVTVTVGAGMSLAGRVAAVVGAPRGLGADVAARLVDAGAKVIVAASGHGKAGPRHAAGASVAVSEPDSADPRLMAGIADQVVSGHGRLDVWIQVGRRRLPADLRRRRGWDPPPESSVWGGYLGMRAVAIRMCGSGGIIVNVAPRPCGGSGLITSRPAARPDRALGHLTETLACELEPFDVRVFGIHSIRAGEHIPVDGDCDGLSRRMIGRLPFGAGQTPTLPDAVAFCASDLSMFMSGSTLLATI